MPRAANFVRFSCGLEKHYPPSSKINKIKYQICKKSPYSLGVKEQINKIFPADFMTV